MTTQSILGNTRRPDISFFASGKIDITSRIVKALDMAEGDVIDIMVGGGEYYFYVSSRSSMVCGKHEAQCYPSKHGSKHFRAYSRRLCAAIFQASGFSNHASFAAGEVVEVNGRKAIPIIIRKNYMP